MRERAPPPRGGGRSARARIIRLYGAPSFPGPLMGDDARPLRGRTIVVTRPREQAADFIEMLESRGAEVIAVPTIQIEPPTDRGPLRSAARAPDRFDWIVFTSANGVERFWAALSEEGHDTRSLAGVSLCAIGEGTAAALERHGAQAALMPREYVAESLVESFRGMGDVRGKRILLPRAEAARSVLPDALREMGAEVTDVAAYRTVERATAAAGIAERLEQGGVDFITFTSSSSVRSFVRMVEGKTGRARVASIGPITSATVRELGWEVAVEAPIHTVAGLCAAIVERVERERGGDRD